jgi:hypothetical protein
MILYIVTFWLYRTGEFTLLVNNKTICFNPFSLGKELKITKLLEISRLRVIKSQSIMRLDT